MFPGTFKGLKDGRIVPGNDCGFTNKCRPEWLPLIDETVSVFGKFDSGSLRSWSCRRGSPWDKASNGGNDLYVQIPGNLIRDAFRSLMTREKQAPAERTCMV